MYNKLLLFLTSLLIMLLLFFANDKNVADIKKLKSVGICTIKVGLYVHSAKCKMQIIS